MGTGGVGMTAELLAARTEDTTYVRIVGRATFVSAHSLRGFAETMLADGVMRFVMDLSKCISMDSTFTGVLAMIAIRGRERAAVVELVDMNTKIDKTLSTLGLKKLFVVSHTRDLGDRAPTLSHVASGEENDERALRRTMLEAHETLTQADPANAPKFRNVIDLIRAQPGRGKDGRKDGGAA
jgi:anti-anti-sigma factor